MKAKPKQYRQGDVFLHRVEEIPENLPPVETSGSRLVLAEGEATGHAHVLTSFVRAAYDSVGDLFVEVSEESSVVHQEHGRIDLPPGKYRVRTQREYQPEAIRTVRD